MSAAVDRKTNKHQKKATDSQLLESYAQTKSVWKTAATFGMCGQSVHERLSKIPGSGVTRQGEFTENQKTLIFEAYKNGFKTGDGVMSELCRITGKSRHSISRFARKHGLTNFHRKCGEEVCVEMGKRTKKMILEQGHPRGSLGMSHSEEAKKKIGEASKRISDSRTADERSAISLKMMKTKEANGTKTTHKHGSWKSDWRVIGGQRCYFRSSWEANYARYLQLLLESGKISKWEHEPKTFWFEKIKRGCVSYLPDFRVTEIDGDSTYFVEVKGWMDARSKTKIERMGRYFPEVILEVVDSKAYRKLATQCKSIIQDWE